MIDQYTTKLYLDGPDDGGSMFWDDDGNCIHYIWTGRCCLCGDDMSFKDDAIVTGHMARSKISGDIYHYPAHPDCVAKKAP